MKLLLTSLALCGLLSAQPSQAPNPASVVVVQTGAAVPIYRVTVVARSTKAVNYHHRGGATKVDFKGTALLPLSHGEAKVESKQGYIEVEVEFRKLQPATTFGREYLTYVMWAITPEGRAANLGEVLLNGTSSKLNVTTEMQSFGMIVTAEPYFAVTQPSDVVVMENVIRQDTKGAVEEVDAKYELLQRGQYTLNVNPSEIKPINLDPKVPLELYEARNAVQIARWAGAERYASETMQKAARSLDQSEGYLARKAGMKPVASSAREAVQMAEDARIITIKKMEEARLAAERQAGDDREARAKADADSAAQGRLQAEARERTEAEGRLRAEGERANAQSETERVKREAETAQLAAQSEANRMKREADAARISAQTEADRLKRESDAQRASAQLDIDRAGREKAEAEAAREAAVAQQQLARAETDKARLAVAEADRLRLGAEAEKAALRAQLLKQFSIILETRDTARGLIVNMSDVLFDTAKYTLRPAAREKLARVGGIISGHPGLKLDIEGFTDSVGNDDYNQTLSEKRSGAVRDYLTRSGISTEAVTARGFGKAQPVASNDTATGRQQNRRVELVVSGEVIGVQIGVPVPSK